MSLFLKQQIGQMLIAGFKGLEIKQGDPIVRDIQEFNLGGVILYDEEVSDPNEKWRNIQTQKQTANLIQSINEISEEKLFIGVDQEGGHVNRLKADYGFPPCSSWHEIGLFNDVNKTRECAELMANTLNKTGFNLNFAPVVDVNSNSASYVSKLERCFNSNPHTIAEHASIFISAHNKQGITTVLKHFPGLGSAEADTHEGFVDITETWTAAELEPYKILLSKHRIDMVMVAHCFHSGVDPDWPASMSSKTVHGLLRSELGYDGVVICDDPIMGAIAKNYSFDTAMEKIINAGVDLLGFGNNLVYDIDIVPKTVNTIYRLVENGNISEDRIVESYERMQSLKTKLQ